MGEYKSALAVESMGCCETKIGYAKSNGIEKNCKFLARIPSMNSFITWFCLLHEFEL